MHMPKVAYIIVCWNNQNLLDECIRSIKSQTYKNRRIIMVDNNSSDDSIKHVTKNYPEVDVLPQSKNHAFAKGNNIGIQYALEDSEVEFISLVNTDATLDPNWTETILKFAAFKPKGAAFQTITLDYYDRNTIDSTHVYVAHNGQATQGSWRRPIATNTDIAPQKVFGCNAAAVVYSRAFIEAQPFSEFFDETMWMYLEDVDVAARATVMGWDNYVIPGARAYHMGSASSSNNPGFSLYYTFRNNGAMLVKNLPLVVLAKVFPRLIKGDIDTIRVLIRNNRVHDIKYVVKGRLVGLALLPWFLGKRLKLRHVVSARSLWRLMLNGY